MIGIRPLRPHPPLAARLSRTWRPWFIPGAHAHVLSGLSLRVKRLEEDYPFITDGIYGSRECHHRCYAIRSSVVDDEDHGHQDDWDIMQAAVRTSQSQKVGGARSDKLRAGEPAEAPVESTPLVYLGQELTLDPDEGAWVPVVQKDQLELPAGAICSVHPSQENTRGVELVPGIWDPQDADGMVFVWFCLVLFVSTPILSIGWFVLSLLGRSRDPRDLTPAISRGE